MAKNRFLETGEMRHLAWWRSQEAKLFAFEKEAFVAFSPQELAFYEFMVRTKQRVRTVVRPLWSWWYGNKADRAFELYVREKTSDHLRSWYLAEVRAAGARGVVDWHVGYADTPPKGEARAATEAWLLRMTRTTRHFETLHLDEPADRAKLKKLYE